MIISMEKLNGLPATGPIPKHCHYCHPTPWREGYTVRFHGTKGQSWVGNFQQGDSYYSDILLWTEALLFIVIAGRTCCFVSAEEPDRYVCHQNTTTDVMFDEARTQLFVADYSDLYAYDAAAAVVWKHLHLAVDGIELKKCHLGFITGRACDDPPERWSDFKLYEADGRRG